MVSESSILFSSSNRSPKFSNSFTTRIFSDVAGDITIVVDGESFLLHKFPLVSRSGKIRRMISDSKDPRIELQGFPGGPHSFELAMKFCYGINFEITPSNVAQLRCAAEYLEMTEDLREQNLIARTEAYLNQVVARSLEKAVRVLSTCTDDPEFEEVGIVGRCIEAIAAILAVDRDVTEDVSVLRVEFFERVIGAMTRAGASQNAVVGTLVHYAKARLKGVGKSRAASPEERAVVEALSGLIPRDRAVSVPLSFLFGMLKMAIMSEASDTCRAELERRIAVRLEMASLDDMLIPSLREGDSLFDVDVIRRMLVVFLQRVEEEEDDDDEAEGDDENEYDSGSLIGSSSHGVLLKVGRLVDSYLAEIAPDPYLSLHKFIGLIELLPDYARVIDDGLYRAVDIYLKAHPLLTEFECKKLCKFIDCSKLSQEACNHAAQNERLPVQLSVKVLYFEQLRLKTTLSAGMPHSQRMTGSGVPSAAMSPRDNYASLRRENRELKLEISRMRVRLSELEKEQVCMKQGMVDKSGSGRTLLTSISKGIGKIGIFGGPAGGGGGGGKRQKSGRKCGGGGGRSRSYSVHS